MLPILRAISVGGVLLAIVILALALSPPGGSRMQFIAVNMSAHGALIDASEHPEWRQFLILAALRRADEINRLRELPDTPTRVPEIRPAAQEHAAPGSSQATTDGSAVGSAKAPVQTAGLATHDALDPDDETGSINAAPGATIPIEIGEPSSTELPLTPPEEQPPVQTLPLTEAPTLDEPPESKISATAPTDRIKPAAKSHKRAVQHRRARASAPAKQPPVERITAPPPFNILQAIFESLFRHSAASTAKPARNKSARKAATAKRQTISRQPTSFRSAAQ